MKYVIFSIDNSNNGVDMVAFKRLWSRIVGTKLTDCEGGYTDLQGDYVEERSFITTWALLEKYGNTVNWAFMQNQESVLRFSECNKKYAELFFLGTGETKYIGSLKDVSREEALAAPAYTYRRDMDTYWIAVKENPDHVEATREAVALEQAAMALKELEISDDVRAFSDWISKQSGDTKIWDVEAAFDRIFQKYILKGATSV